MKIEPRSYAPKGKRQISKVIPERRNSGKSDGQKSRKCKVIAPKNWLIAQDLKRGRCTARGSKTNLNKWASKPLYQKTHEPWLIFPRNFRTICEQPSTEGKPLTMFLRILPPQDNTHDCSRAHQIAFKTYLDWEIRPRWWIPARQRKRIDSSNIHRNCRETCLSLLASALWYHTRNIRIYHHQFISNRHWERSS